MAPRLAPNGTGALLTWLEPADASRKAFRLMTSELDGDTWSPAVQVIAGEDFFANWADLPAAVEGGGARYAHWLAKLGAGTYAYGVRLARSIEGGDWQPIGLLHDDASPTEHGFVSYAPSDGGVQAFWLDGRAMAGGHSEGGQTGAMQLRTTRLTSNGDPPASVLLDERVCECCQTDAATTTAGPIVVYRDRDASEVRDVAVVRAAGDDWTVPAIPHPDGWRIHGCPVNGPAVAAEGDVVALAWFTAAGERPRVQVAFSGDSGASFEPPIEVDSERPLGRVDVALGPDGAAYVSWLATVEEAAEIRLRRVTPGGAAGEALRIAGTTSTRAAGVPRMARAGDDLLVTWTDAGDGEDADRSSVRVAVVDLAE